MWWEPLLYIMCGEKHGWLVKKDKKMLNGCLSVVCIYIGLESNYESLSDIMSYAWMSSEEGDACMGPGVPDLTKPSSE